MRKSNFGDVHGEFDHVRWVQIAMHPMVRILLAVIGCALAALALAP